MNILAFDSSSKSLSVALVADGVLLGEVNLNVKKNHSTTLMTTVDFLLAQAGFDAADLDRIAVAQGPGSYTGLRLAATVGKTLAYSLDKEIVGVSSLLAIAARIKSPKSLVVPVMDARRGNAYAAVYENGKVVVADQHCVFSEFLTDLSEKVNLFDQVIFTGETENFVADIEAAGFDSSQILSDSLTKLPSAYEIAKIAENLSPVSVHGFAPHYLKKVEAEEKWLENHEESTNDTENYVQRI
ncbi:tRNA (adenosine(37)-N6)-threonylcarbamoyltransferase complex dimerization subunit type 1 TsaB [Lactococcus nasutitermitis]|uniref:tRNA (Adenosine(37)-N6)-threonylcarbamoyltransferase complex dimerization subunit type 1 TsaB n=1 Tax=Lactococcus nasutitermitis TaxID=1652957 RepID=A0ABV9JF12_9LACT|nr:tRNA (adenosine(37)-N6)-threonylcarbamoyltransferase complex dimerization subunit type 1 TsaB [Lactococcus nasutitermitis]